MSKYPTTKQAVQHAFHIITHGYGSLVGAPNYARELAEIVSLSSGLDYRLVVAVSRLTETPLAVIERGLHEVSNTHTRIKILRAMNKDFAPSDTFRGRLATLLVDAENIAKERAKYVHGYWTVSKLTSKQTVTLTNRDLPITSKQRDRKVPLKELKDLVAKFRDIHSRLSLVITSLPEAPPLPETLSQRLPLRRQNRGRGKSH